VHTSPEDALSDGEQSLLPENFQELMQDLGKIARAVDREM